MKFIDAWFKMLAKASMVRSMQAYDNTRTRKGGWRKAGTEKMHGYPGAKLERRAHQGTLTKKYI